MKATNVRKEALHIICTLFHLFQRASYQVKPFSSVPGFSSSPYTRDLSNRTISHHFLASDNEPTCLISKFVQNVAANLLQCPSLSPYHDLIAADPKLRHLISEEACAFDPWQSFVAGILNPLKQLKSQGRLPQRYYLILIDALCEGECHRNERGESILGFLERVLGENVLPGWIKFICTVRTGLLDLAKKLPFQRFR